MQENVSYKLAEKNLSNVAHMFENDCELMLGKAFEKMFAMMKNVCINSTLKAISRA